MSWDLTGERIEGRYIDIPYTGTVESSRVKYGGAIQHTVVLDEAITVFGEIRTRILVDDRLDGESHPTLTGRSTA